MSYSIPLTEAELASVRRDGPTLLEVAHALRSTADWVRTAPPEERCSGRLASQGDRVACDPNDPGAKQWCALGRLAKNLDIASGIYVIWEAHTPPGQIGIHTRWDHACYHPRDQQQCFELVAQELEANARRIETLIPELERALA